LFTYFRIAKGEITMKIRGITNKLLFMTIAAFFALMTSANAQTIIAFQGFESTTPANNWAYTNTGGAVSTNAGATDTPANSRIRTGAASFLVSNTTATLNFANVTIPAGYTGVQVIVHISSTSGTTGNGADAGDQVRVSTALNGSAFPATPDITVEGNTNSRYDYNDPDADTTTAGTPITVVTAGGATNTAPKRSTLIINIPNGTTSVALQITAVNNNVSEFWNIDDVTLQGVAPAAAAPTITSANNTTFTVGTAGTFTVTTTGSPTPTLSVSGTLPTGVTFTDNGNGTATIAGTPGAGTAGSYPITITASNGTAPDATQNFTLTVSPGAGCVGVPVSLPTSTVEAETTILVPVTVGDLTGLNITSYEFTVSYDTSVLQLASPAFETTGTLTGAAGGYTVFNDTTVPSGQVRIGAFGTTPLSGAGTLIFIRFNVLPGPGMVTSPLKFIDFRFGEGTPADCTTNGSVTRFGPTAAPANIGGRVMTAGGKSISKVRVMISGGDLEEPIYVLTNGFGYYNFENLSVGETYIIEVKAKGYKFANPTLVINLQDNLTGTDFIGEVEIYGAK
jgi:hypothetical protein